MLRDIKDKVSSAVEGNKHWVTDSKMVNAVDGWINAATGMGILGKDKGESTTFKGRNDIPFGTLDELGRKDGIARKIVDRVVDDSLRMGWTVTFKGDDDNDIDPSDAKELNEKLERWYKDTGFKHNLNLHLKQARQYGGSLLVLGAADGQPPEMPLDPEKVTSFSWTKALDRHQVSQSSSVDVRPDSPHFSFPLFYRLHSVHGHVSFGQFHRDIEADLLRETGEQQVAPNEIDLTTLSNVNVHASRVWRTDGVFLSDRVRLRNEGWGDSVLETAWEPLRNWSSVMSATRTLVQDFAQGVYKIKDFKGVVLANGDAAVRKRFALMDFVKSIYNAVIVDADNEDYERKATSVTGLSEVLDRFAMHLSAVVDQPLTLLFGVSPGGFGTGEAEGDNWDDTCKAYQTDIIQPVLEYVLGVLFQTPEFEDFPKNWSIKFNPLQLTDPIEDANVRKLTAETDAIYVQNAVLGPDEVAMSRFGGSGYSTETNLNEQAREMEAALAEEGLAQGAEVEALNGIQITSILSILERVKIGILPKESAKPLMAASFPQMPVDLINAMVDPVEVTGPTAETDPSLLPTASTSQPAPSPVSPTPPDGEEDAEE